MAPRRQGQSPILVIAVALMSYLSFETIAKTTLIAAAILFILDPYPPYSRIIALVSCIVVSVLGRLHSQALQELKEQEESSTEVTATESSTRDKVD